MWLLSGQLQNVPVGGHSYIHGGPELPVALVMGAKLKEELSAGTEHFH